MGRLWINVLLVSALYFLYGVTMVIGECDYTTLTNISYCVQKHDVIIVNTPEVKHSGQTFTFRIFIQEGKSKNQFILRMFFNIFDLTQGASITIRDPPLTLTSASAALHKVYHVSTSARYLDLRVVSTGNTSFNMEYWMLQENTSFDGSWSLWSPWSGCQAINSTQGQQNRSRVCVPAYGQGRPCDKNTQEVMACQLPTKDPDDNDFADIYAPILVIVLVVVLVISLAALGVKLWLRHRKSHGNGGRSYNRVTNRGHLL